MNDNDILEVPASCLALYLTVWTTDNSNYFLMIGFRLNIFQGYYIGSIIASLLCCVTVAISEGTIMSVCLVVGQAALDCLATLQYLSMGKIRCN